jgi:hypothetical protein
MPETIIDICAHPRTRCGSIKALEAEEFVEVSLSDDAENPNATFFGTLEGSDTSRTVVDSLDICRREFQHRPPIEGRLNYDHRLSRRSGYEPKTFSQASGSFGPVSSATAVKALVPRIFGNCTSHWPSRSAALRVSFRASLSQFNVTCLTIIEEAVKAYCFFSTGTNAAAGTRCSGEEVDHLPAYHSQSRKLFQCNSLH